MLGMAPSSSGLGYLVLIQKIAGSNPAGVTIKSRTLIHEKTLLKERFFCKDLSSKRIS
jgi:hypothetical protein